MNPDLERLQRYPFERLAELKAGAVPRTKQPHVALSIGEPKHAPPQFALDMLCERTALAQDLATYPATRGSDALREAISRWILARFSARVDPATQILPVAGTREALFSFAQAVVDRAQQPLVLMPNPFYQIYEGAALLAGAEPVFLNTPAHTAYLPDFERIEPSVWQRTQLLYICTPGNPTGAAIPLERLQWLIEQAHRYDFVIASDECYSEIYPDEAAPPPGLLEASSAMGNDGHARCVVFHSLSKRSNLPGLRSGFVAGDANVLNAYYQYRTYEGCALPAHVQRVSAAAWADEQHVIENRALYREKFTRLPEVLSAPPAITHPDGGFYWWLPTPVDDCTFARELYIAQNITVLPGSFLARDTADGNPGSNHVRIAWVAPIEQCLSAAQQIREFMLTL